MRRPAFDVRSATGRFQIDVGRAAAGAIHRPALLEQWCQDLRLVCPCPASRLPRLVAGGSRQLADRLGRAPGTGPRQAFRLSGSESGAAQVAAAGHHADGVRSLRGLHYARASATGLPLGRPAGGGCRPLSLPTSNPCLPGSLNSAGEACLNNPVNQVISSLCRQLAEKSGVWVQQRLARRQVCSRPARDRRRGRARRTPAHRQLPGSLPILKVIGPGHPRRRASMRGENSWLNSTR